MYYSKTDVVLIYTVVFNHVYKVIERKILNKKC